MGGIEPSDLWLLFKLLDVDGSGTIDPEEMVTGCTRLKGIAKAFDVAVIRHEQKRIRTRFDNFSKFMKEAMGIIIDRLPKRSVYESEVARITQNSKTSQPRSRGG